MHPSQIARDCKLLSSEGYRKNDLSIAQMLVNAFVRVALDDLRPQAREPFVRSAAANKRPRHLILLETTRDQVQEEDALALNELRRALDAGELGGEGFQTALRLGGGSAVEVKRILFRPPPREDE